MSESNPAAARLLIIGGSDAGISAALRIRELDARAAVTVVVADAFPNFSICGIPFLLSGEVADWRSLAHRSVAEIEARGIELLLEHRAESIDQRGKSVRVVSSDGRPREIAYDRLLIATGAVSARPPITGLDIPGVFLLRSMSDGLAVKHHMEREKPRRAAIIGGGYIGLEMADALTCRGLDVTLMEFAPEVLASLDPDLGSLVRAELGSRGVRVVTGVAVSGIERVDGGLLVRAAASEAILADLVLVATGARPSVALARSAGVALGTAGAIRVDRTMATGTPDILAAGDCAETWHRLLGRADYLPLGTTAHKQGRIAGENLLGGSREFPGSLGTQVVKVFGRVAARTGLRDKEATAAGFDPLTVALTTWDHKVYYPGARELHIRITGDRGAGRLLGAQIVGHRNSEIAKRIDILAAALFHGMRVEELCDLDLAYTPPLSTPWDPVQVAALEWCARISSQ